MDSLTQLALGAAVGEVVLGPKLGNQAILWGALAGTLPDLDVLMSPWLDDLGFLIHHRGITHSLLVLTLATPVLAALTSWWYSGRSEAPSFASWSALFFGCLVTHVLLDVCTTYGTPLFLPLSDRRVALNNIFIVDPLYTLPLLAAVIACLFLQSGSASRHWTITVGIGLSCLYLGLTFAGKDAAQRAFVESLEREGVYPRRLMTGPTPLNSILWYCLAEVDDGYYVGYHSLFDRDRHVQFRFLPRKDGLLRNLKQTYAVDRLIWFADGYYAVRQENEGLVFHVLKFGFFSLDADLQNVAFSYQIQQDDDKEATVHKLPRQGNLDWRSAFAKLGQRLKGGQVEAEEPSNRDW